MSDELPPNEIEFDPDNSVDFACPFCGAAVIVGKVIGMPDDTRTAIHKSPPCKTFVELDVVDFVTAARRAFGLPEPGDPN